MTNDFELLWFESEKSSNCPLPEADRGFAFQLGFITFCLLFLFKLAFQFDE